MPHRMTQLDRIELNTLHTAENARAVSCITRGVAGGFFGAYIAGNDVIQAIFIGLVAGLGAEAGLYLYDLCCTKKYSAMYNNNDDADIDLEAARPAPRR